MDEAHGRVTVQIPAQKSDSGYEFKNVQLTGIQSLKDVAGDFARFFYTPGSDGQHLTGSSPHARFILDHSVYIPTDLISTEMATIYYHMQQLAGLDHQAGADGVNQWPRSIGLETQVLENQKVRRNNAFYNGETDSMMFVPFSAKDLPIALNAGIIAHEHFHSLFYKTVIKMGISAQKLFINSASIHSDNSMAYLDIVRQMKPMDSLDSTETASLFNETYLRGMNEGLADYWGWVYTEDPEFMRWSLPSYQADRTLNMPEKQLGVFLTQSDIQNKISETLQNSDDPKPALQNYAYFIGTPQARFLKQLATTRATSQKISIGESKIQVAQLVFQYLQDLSTQIKELGKDQMLSPKSLFSFVEKQSLQKTESFQLSQNECELLVAYLNQDRTKDEPEKNCQMNSTNTASVRVVNSL